MTELLRRRSASIPFAALVRHDGHALVVRWDDGSHDLLSLVPLRVSPTPECCECGRSM